MSPAMSSNDSGGGAYRNVPSVTQLPSPVRDFSAFMMFFHDMFMRDSFYTDFRLTNDLQTSSIIGEGAQFAVQRLSLQGGMAVRTSKDPHTRKTNGANVALKKPKIKNAIRDFGRFSESRVVDGIVNELRILSHPPLRTHDKILDVYGFAWELDAERQPGDIWPVLVVEYASLGTLEDCLKNKELSFQQKLSLACDIAEALDVLHKCGIVHSDLKPGNVLVFEEAHGKLTAKLADFGNSIILAEHNPFELWNRGTEGWMAPEWRTEVTLEQLHRTDVYGCGLLLWTILLDGQYPWQDDTFRTSGRPNMDRFETAKKSGDLVDITDAQLRSRLSEEEIAIILPCLREMMGRDINTRSLQELLNMRSASSSSLVNPSERLSERKSIQSSNVVENENGPRDLFSSYTDIIALAQPVQRRLHSALEGISGDVKNELQWRRAEACYSLFVFHVECIGTVRPTDPGSPIPQDFTGYELEAKTALNWLRKAAHLGHHAAQAAYLRVSEALEIPLSPEEMVQAKTWLVQSAFQGNHTALDILKQIDFDLWSKTSQYLRTQLCGIGIMLAPGCIDNSITTRNITSFIQMAAGKIHDVSDRGDSLLHRCSMCGFLGGVLHLIADYDESVDVDAQNSFKETALLQACRSGHIDIARVLLSKGADASLCTDNKENPLHWLSSFVGDKDQIFEVSAKMVRNGAVVNQSASKNKCGITGFGEQFLTGTPLRRATGLKALDAVIVLLKLGADPYDGGDKNDPPIVEAAHSHSDEILELFLPPHYPIQHPGWYKKPLVRKRDMAELLFAVVGRAKSMELAAPRGWANMEMQGNARSLLGYAVSPMLLYLRMISHGGHWMPRMKNTINLILRLGDEDLARVSPANTTSTMEAVFSGDVHIVSHLLDTCPEVSPLLTYPRPNGYSIWFPLYAAIANPNRQIFDVLLRAAGPNTPLSVPPGQGISHWLQSKAFELGEHTLGASPTGHQFATILHLCANVTEDPYFARCILEQISNPENLVTTAGHFGEMPLAAAMLNHNFALAELMMEHHAPLENGGRPGPRLGAMAAGIGLSWSESWTITMVNSMLEGGLSALGWVLRLNNNASYEDAEFLLAKAADFVVDKATKLTALHVVIQAGQRYNREESTMEQVSFYSCNEKNLKLVLDHFPEPEHIDSRDGIKGYTALHWAVSQRDVTAAKKLKKEGARLDVLSDDGATALELLDHIEIPNALKARGRGAVREWEARGRELRSLLQNDVEAIRLHP